MQEHSMRLRPKPFEAIRNGTKRIEMRLMDEKRKLVRPGDTIVFTNTDTKERLTVSVEFVEAYPSFGEIYETYSPVELGYAPEEPFSPSDMSQYYSEEDIAEYGVLAIGIIPASFSF